MNVQYWNSCYQVGLRFVSCNLKRINAKRIVAIVLVSISFSYPAHAQLLQQSDTINSKRVITIAVGVGGVSIGSLLVLNQVWYKGYEKSAFHFFNDNKEWLQMDKVGHGFSAYILTNYSNELLKWAGVPPNKAVWYASIYSFSYISAIEVLDGFSAKWGASYGDIIANIVGVGMFSVQEKVWNEQRIIFKFSTSPKKYETTLSNRVDNLFGQSFPERILKDYNAQSYWLSINLKSFAKKSKIPPWLNVALGYGAEGMLGGFENIWIANNQEVNRTDIKRYRQYLLSLDLDLTKINTKHKFLKVALGALNSIKIPFPGIIFSTKGVMLKPILY